MAVLLDLPNEILEMVIQAAFGDVSPDVDLDDDWFNTVCALKATHRRFIALVDPYVFENMVWYMDVADADRANHLWEKITRPSVRRHLEVVTLSCHAADKADANMGYFMQSAQDIIERITTCLHSSHGTDRPPTFPTLKVIVASDAPAAIIAPFLAPLAPDLSEVLISSEHMWDAAESPCFTLPQGLDKLPALRLHYLRLWDVSAGPCWILALLNSLRVCTEEIVICPKGDWGKTADAQELYHAIKRIGQHSPQLRHITIGYTGEQVKQRIDRFSCEGMSRRDELIRKLFDEDWAGRKVVGRVTFLKEDWQEVFEELESDGIPVEIEDVVEFIDLATDAQVQKQTSPSDGHT